LCAAPAPILSRAALLNPDIADDRDLLRSIIDDLLALGAV
jgi:hypothetical protein